MGHFTYTAYTSKRDILGLIPTIDPNLQRDIQVEGRSASFSSPFASDHSLV